MSAPAPVGLHGQRTLTDWLLLLVLVVCWGSSFAITKIAVETIPASWVAAGRLSVAAAVLLPLVIVRGRGLAHVFKHWGWVLWLTLAGTIVPFVLMAWGTKQIASGLAGVLMAFVPLVILVFAHFLLPDERMTRPKAIGFGLGFTGVIILIGPQNLVNFEAQGMAFWGQAAIIASTLFYGSHAATTRLMPSVGTLELATATMLLGAVIALPLCLWTAPSALADASVRSLLALAALGVFPTAIASLALYRSLTRAGATFTATCNYMIPIYAVVLGAVWLDEVITLTTIGGCALVLTGIAVSQRLYRHVRVGTAG